MCVRQQSTYLLEYIPTHAFLCCVCIQVQELCQLVDAELGYGEEIKLWNPTSNFQGMNI